MRHAFATFLLATRGLSTEPLRQVRDHFSDVVDLVEREHERVTVIRKGRAAAVIIGPEDLAEV